MKHRIRHALHAPLLAMALAAPHAPVWAIELVEFTFGTSVGTTSAQTVATHIAATTVVSRKSDGSAAPYSFADLGNGNMAMKLLKSEGGYRFEFTLTADPGYTFQVTDAHFAFRTQNTAGVNRNITVWPNADHSVIWYDAAGGDTIFNDMGPGGFGWKTSYWNAFVTRTDLQTLHVQLSLRGNSQGSVALFDRVLLEGNVIAVPEPSTAALMLGGAAALGLARRRRRAGAIMALRPRLTAHPRALALAALLALATPWHAVAAPMPAGSQVWMVLDSNACDADGNANCDTSNAFGAGQGIPWQTSDEGNGTWTTGFAEAHADRLHSYIAGYGGTFMYLSMHDTYTVHGALSGEFALTVHLTAQGSVDSVVVRNGSNWWSVLNAASVELEIGTFSPSTADPFSEQFRINPFPGSSLLQTWPPQFVYQGAPFSHPVNAATSHTRNVSSGDVFDLGFGVTSHVAAGAFDLRDTAHISFDLPPGVWLTSANGAIFGTPVPEPATTLLWAAGAMLLHALRRRRDGVEGRPRLSSR